MNLNHISASKNMLLLVLTFLSLQLGAVKPSTSSTEPVQQNIREHSPQKHNSKLSLKQKISFFLIKKLSAKKAKREKKNKTKKKNKLAKFSFLFGILSLLFFPLAFAPSIVAVALVGIALVITFAILAIVCSAKAVKEIKLDPDKFSGRGMATTGLILGIIALSSLFVILLLALLLFVILNIF